MRHDVRLFDAITALRRLLKRKSLPPVAILDELADFLAAQTGRTSPNARCSSTAASGRG